MQQSLQWVIARLAKLHEHAVKLRNVTSHVEKEEGLLRKAIYQSLEREWLANNEGAQSPREFTFAIEKRRFRSSYHSALGANHAYSLTDLGADPQEGNLTVEFPTFGPRSEQIDEAVKVVTQEQPAE